MRPGKCHERFEKVKQLNTSVAIYEAAEKEKIVDSKIKIEEITIVVILVILAPLGEIF